MNIVGVILAIGSALIPVLLAALIGFFISSPRLRYQCSVAWYKLRLRGTTAFAMCSALWHAGGFRKAPQLPPPRYSCEAWPYERALCLMRVLAMVGIECHVDIGCIAIYCPPDRLGEVIRICRHMGASKPYEGSDSYLKRQSLEVAARMQGT